MILAQSIPHASGISLFGVLVIVLALAGILFVMHFVTKAFKDKSED